MRSEPTESRLGEELLEVAGAQIGAGDYQLAVVISQVAVETVAEIAFTVLFGVNVPRSRETMMKVLPDRSFLVMAENDAGDIQGHLLAYAHGLQETPFRFTSAAQLTDTTKLGASCRPHRGPSSAPCSCSTIGLTPHPRRVGHWRSSTLEQCCSGERRRVNVSGLSVVMEQERTLSRFAEPRVAAGVVRQQVGGAA